MANNELLLLLYFFYYDNQFCDVVKEKCVENVETNDVLAAFEHVWEMELTK